MMSNSKTRRGPATYTRPAADQAEQVTIPPEAQPFMTWGNNDILTCRQVAILLTVRANPGLSTGGLAGAIGVAKTVVTRAIDRLTSMGLVRRSVDDADRRLVQVWPIISKKGR
jgi:predicted transcriptional regulator